MASSGTQNRLAEAASALVGAAAAQRLSGEQLRAELRGCGGAAAVVEAAVELWEGGGAASATQRARVLPTTAPQLLHGTSTSLHVPVAAGAGASSAALLEPRAVIQLQLEGGASVAAHSRSQLVSGEKGSALQEGCETLGMELSSSLLLQLFDKLETIQQQLDNLA